MPEDVFEIVGTVVGGSFRVERVVAEGGFAVVYQAYHGAFHAPVALKCLKVPTVRGREKISFLEGFREEGEMMFRLSQSIPTVVRPLHIDAFETAAGVLVPYMALEWLEGDTLDVLIAKRAVDGLKPLSPRRVVRMLAPVARALERAHRFPGPDGPVSIVHRDLKPDNILIANINGEEIVKILDFGIAKMKSVASQVAGRMSQSTGANSVPFTPGYAAPEQWLPKRFGQTGPWTDVWGLALCAVEAMSGKPAIDGDHAGMMGTAIDDKRRPSPRSEGVELSDEAEQVFLTALAVDPRDRYQSVGQFWNDLERALGLESTSTKGTGTFSAYRDPRSEGPPAKTVERVSVSRDLAPPNKELVHRAIPTLQDPALRAPKVPDMQVPDLDHAQSPRARTGELEFDLSSSGEAPPSSKGGLQSKEQPAENKPKPSETQGDEAGVGGSSMIEVGLGGGMSVNAAESFHAAGTESQSSGIDLAVSPSDVRRASNANMKAVRISNPKMPAVKAAAPSTKSSSRTDLPAVSPSSSRRKADAAPVSVRSGAHRAVSSRGTVSKGEPPSWLKLLLVPTVLTVIGFALAGGYYVRASTGGGRLMLGPIPMTWIAGLFALSGVGLGVWRMLFPPELD